MRVELYCAKDVIKLANKGLTLWEIYCITHNIQLKLARPVVRTHTHTSHRDQLLLHLPPHWPSPVTQASYLQPLQPICPHSALTVNQQQAASPSANPSVGLKHRTTAAGTNAGINNKFDSLMLLFSTLIPLATLVRLYPARLVHVKLSDWFWPFHLFDSWF